MPTYSLLVLIPHEKFTDMPVKGPENYFGLIAIMIVQAIWLSLFILPSVLERAKKLCALQKALLKCFSLTHTIGNHVKNGYALP
jgi:hypothetical protein